MRGEEEVNVEPCANALVALDVYDGDSRATVLLDVVDVAALIRKLATTSHQARRNRVAELRKEAAALTAQADNLEGALNAEDRMAIEGGHGD